MKKIFPLFLIAALAVSSCSKKDDAVNIINTPASSPLSAGFTIINQGEVKENVTPAQFRNTSVNAVSYKWDFGTGDISTDREPIYDFPGCGPKTVTLTATDAKGNQQTFSVQLEVLCTGKHAPQGH